MVKITTLVILFVILFSSDASSQMFAKKHDLWNQKETTLRGANIWQNTLYKKKRPFKFSKMENHYSAANIKLLRNWGANYVNISHPGIYHLKETGDTYPPVPQIEKNLKDLINKCGDNELFVVISFRTGPGRSEEVFKTGDLKPEEADRLVNYLFEIDKDTKQLTTRAIKAQDAWVNMWKETANKFKNHPHVIGYDLLVEPYTDLEQKTSELKYQSGIISDESREIWLNFASKMAKAVRIEDKKTPILIGPAPYNAAWALSELEAGTLANDICNLVITAHQYDPFCYTYQPYQKHEKLPIEYNQCYKEILEDRYQRISSYFSDTLNNLNCPVAVNEFGVTRWAGPKEKPDSSIFLKDHFCLLEKLGCNHALWLWEVDSIDYYEFHFRLGENKKNIKGEASDDDNLIKVIKDNWKKNKVFAKDEIIQKWDE